MRSADESLPSLTRRLLLVISSAFADLARGSRVVAAVSGGPDSVALAHLMARALPPLGLEVCLAHLDHALRPDSHQDAEFVRALASSLAFGFHGSREDVAALARTRGGGLEEAGRDARYRFLATTATAIGASAVAIGHTLDDSAETLLLNLLRGTGGAGLAGIAAQRGALWRRPLIGVRRTDLVRFLASISAAWRVDASNLDPRFRRNWLRAEVLPRLEEANPRVIESLSRTARVIADESDYLDRVAAEVRDPLEIATLVSLPAAIARRAVLMALRRACADREMSHDHVDGILSLAHDLPGARSTDLPGGLRALRKAGRVVLEAGLATAPEPRAPGPASPRAHEPRLPREVGEVLITETAILRRIAELGRLITGHYQGSELVVVTLLKGGLFFAADLIRRIELPTTLETLRISTYLGQTTPQRPPRMSDDPDAVPEDLLAIRGRHVLLVDDIVDTGATLAYAQKTLLGLHPRSLRSACLLSKAERRTSEVKVEWIGFDIPDRFVIGYGLDYRERFRALPFVAVLNESEARE